MYTTLMNCIFLFINTLMAVLCIDTLEGSALGEGMYLYWGGLAYSIIAMSAQFTLLINNIKKEYYV